MSEKGILLQDIKAENESYSDDALFNITSFGTDMTFRELIMMYDEGDLEKPELQRKYVWTKNEASRFIDSILLGLPVPSIFLAKTSDEKRLIVDGYQRIMTVYDFVNGIFSADCKIFKLSNSGNININWRGKAFKELTNDEQRKIRNSSIHAIVFEQKYPQSDTGMYQIFERINTSGKILKPQEIRNCVYNGSFNNLLMNLNKHSLWRKVLDSQKEDSRMSDVELILRFFAISFIKENEEINQKQINLTKYLNEFMGRNSNIDSNQAAKYTNYFITVLTYLHKTIGNELFRNIKEKDGTLSYTKRINPVIFDAVSAATLYKIINNITCDDKLKRRYTELLKNPDFKQAISIRTTNIDSIKSRISTAAKILYGIEYEW